MKELGRQFLSFGLDVVPRVLGLTDRDHSSPTAGCCDRPYWHYRLTDIANARFQEAGWLFALAATVPDESNRFYGSEMLASLARQTWSFWLDRRNRDGSVAEVYPHERSFCATAFTARAFVETVRLLGGADHWSDELAAASRTLRWLGINSNTETANQMAASLHALSGYSVLTGDAETRELAGRRRDAVAALADAEGTFSEYGGLDVGYQSVTMSCLTSAARIEDRDSTLNGQVEAAERRVLGSLDSLGRHDSGANSRSTQFLYPFAFAVARGEGLDRLQAGFTAGALILPAWLDDRYCIGLATDYLLAARELLDVDDDRSADSAADA